MPKQFRFSALGLSLIQRTQTNGNDATFGTLDTGTGPSGGGLDYILSSPTASNTIATNEATLHVKTAVTAAAAIGQAALYYSTDNGNTWTQIYLTSPSTRPLTIDNISLAVPINLGRVQVKAEVVTNVSSGQHVMEFYEAWLTIE